MQRRPTHRCSIWQSRFFPEPEQDMSTTRYEGPDLRGIAVTWALAAALLAGACGGESSELLTRAGDGSIAAPAKFHTLGGTISGLTRPGLVLANGTDTVSVAANATTFTLPAPVATHDTYAVTVAGQPAGLTCSVSKGSGAMPASEVTHVKVRCSDNPSTVGGNARTLVLLLGLARSARNSPR
jgi:hypothetical protein